MADVFLWVFFCSFVLKTTKASCVLYFSACVLKLGQFVRIKLHFILYNAVNGSQKYVFFKNDIFTLVSH